MIIILPGVTGRAYAAAFAVLVLIWPLIFIPFAVTMGGPPEMGVKGWLILGVVFASNAGWFIFCARQCGSPPLGFFRGLSIIAGGYMTGCVNITIFVVLPVLCVSYFLCSSAAMISVFSGRYKCQRFFMRHVHAMCGGRFPLEPALQTIPEPRIRGWAVQRKRARDKRT